MRYKITTSLTLLRGMSKDTTKRKKDKGQDTVARLFSSGRALSEKVRQGKYLILAPSDNVSITVFRF